jgi:hypothetical protein
MASFKRAGLHKLECPMCDGYTYGTVANLEEMMRRHGRLPSCACGDTFQPTELELAMILGASESRPMVNYLRECNSVAKGQAAHGRAGRVLKRTPEEVAAERVEAERRSHAVYRQLAAILPVPVSASEAIPF